MKYPLLCVKRGLCNCFWVWSKSAHPRGLKPWPSPCPTCSRRIRSPPSLGGLCRQSQQHWVWSCRYLPQFPCRQQDGKGASSAFPRGLRTEFALSVRWPMAAVSRFPWALLSGFLVSESKTWNHEAHPLLSCWLSLLKESKAARPKRREERCLDSDLEQTAPREGLGGQGSGVVSLLGKLWDKWYMDVYVSWHSSL